MSATRPSKEMMEILEVLEFLPDGAFVPAAALGPLNHWLRIKGLEERGLIVTRWMMPPATSERPPAEIAYLGLLPAGLELSSGSTP